MIIAVDEAIPYWKEAFSTIGELRPFDGRKLRPEDVRDVDALVVRSVTKVNAALLESSSVQFVGTATIGMDHLDEPYLRARDIYFTNAAGSNANSVAEYVVTALLAVAHRRSWDLPRKSIAIIGVGRIGSRVENYARALGMEVVLCDPPLRESSGDAKYRLLEDVLWADIFTLHVPLTLEGPCPTRAMFNEALFKKLSPRQYLINTARGPVVRGSALKNALREGRLEGAVLDVFEGEPRIDYSILEFVDLVSAHIAGYSLDGKVRGTEMIVQELCRHFRLSTTWDTRSLFPAPKVIRAAKGSRGLDALRSLVLRAYDIRVDDHNLRGLAKLSEDEARTEFDRLRNEYNLRPEFRHSMVELEEGQADLQPVMTQLGFQTRAAAGLRGN